MSVGVPVKLLQEAIGHIVTLEMKNGHTYRGKLLESEDNMNVQVGDVTATARDGQVSKLEQIFIRGSHIRFVIVPDILKHAPMFQRFGPEAQKLRGLGMGRGKHLLKQHRGRGRGGPRGRGFRR
ncbi:small nuclear ribonucleoprotein Sm D3 [Dimargaris verticillata]|uniref:Small nuclear ribonucleoprotein Sm D3 n=1 Tax=Dimargaris verticillata TaxID=2761393 RepID=A0A9W8B0I7_9FUNG|nr:small nuclear ribonucleoprotein Sm D3 [Dimargaris verticillata]